MAAASLLALVAGCAGPQFVPHPESGIELRWPNGAATVGEARADAAARCAGGQAVLGAESIDRDETLARFFCA